MSIAKQLNQEGVPTWTTRSGWYRDYIKKILQTPAVYGVYTPGKRLGKHKRIKLDPIPDYFPPIISEETFLQAPSPSARAKAEDRATMSISSPHFYDVLSAMVLSSG